ncbi:30S ribosomal protein S12 methylthiotransferase RimO [Candidatus Atelocyanobacterium thalassae]|uniref:Ribosomal protein uS12 methylthiotransferase RimO n=2 Tax=Candidatus Atelocyanobacterium thalassae TaxID=713887 RepID=A0A086CGE9_9CHRO|nr:30S ribosomal protein S12 methylthiotransferase RimO [Candidatus Atelocyanobacterium thalassa]KFF41263.1 MAG: SSU ribosomal protein S12P methylthiotransferase [Candidatus Atelocyanobacterium thalassa isolate SIO64986]BDA40065.1 ribosomal protein S12 methylthiotransferase RimO [cyanobacterium endosymbiont of Braarudosphaera bigelowii]
MVKKPAIAISHLGCEKNRIDSEHILGLLATEGYSVSSSEHLADYVVVNTCSFIQQAREESVRTLVELAENNKKIIVAGCMAQHFQNQLLEELPEVVAIVGTGNYQDIVKTVQRVELGERVIDISQKPTFIADETIPRYRTTNEGVAYLRIAEGCDYRCTFCIIPHLRGNQRSRTIESIVAEARQLADQGVQEIILVSQITTNYGLDLYGKAQLAELLQALGKVNIPWIRVHYAYPTGLTTEVLQAVKEVPNVIPYLDLPLQHSHPNILKAMNRPWKGTVNDEIIEVIKTSIPNVVLRTTFIVGFPGETDEYFEHLVKFIKRHQFDHVGVFVFSPEEETPSYRMLNQVPLEIAQERRDYLMEIQQPISSKKNKQYIDTIIEVLIEQENPKTHQYIGRSIKFSPDVDGVVFVKGEAQLNSIIPVKITKADAYDLYGKVVDT